MPKFNEKSKISEIIKDPRALPIIEKYIPGAMTSPHLKMAMGITIKGALFYRNIIGLSREQALSFKEEILALD